MNFAVAQNEGVAIHTIDHIASMTACWMKKGNLSSEDPWWPSGGTFQMLTKASSIVR